MRLAIIGDFQLSENYPNTINFIRSIKSDPRFDIVSCNGGSSNQESLYNTTTSSKNRLITAVKLLYKGMRSARLMWQLNTSECDAIYIPYPAIFVLFLHRLRLLKSNHSPVLVMDCFISVYDTLVFDRGKLKASSLVARLVKFIEAKAIAQADVVLTDTHANRTYLQRMYGGDSRKYQAINLCINETLFSPVRNTNNDTIEVLFVGSLVPLQGAEVVVKAAQELRKHTNIHFTLLGTGQTESLVDEALSAEKANLDWNKKWHSIEEIAMHYRRADICLGVFGRTAKTTRVLPYKIYMALACAKPVISIKPDREVLNGEATPFVTILEPTGMALANAILELAKSCELRQRYMESGKNYYQENLSNSRAVDTFHDLLSTKLSN